MTVRHRDRHDVDAEQRKQDHRVRNGGGMYVNKDGLRQISDT